MIQSTRFTIAGAARESVACSLSSPGSPGPHPLVVLVHGFKGFSDWGFFPLLTERLTEAGLAALRVNFSHNGTGQDEDAVHFTRLDLFERDRMSYRLLDLQTAIRATWDTETAIDRARLGLLGHSLGGAVCLLALKSLDVRALVTLASVDDTRFTPEQEETIRRDGRVLIPNARTNQMMPVGIAALRDLWAHADEYDLDAAAGMHGLPWLIAHGGADPTVPVAAARRLAGLAGERATLQVIDGADHVLGCKHPFEGPTPAFNAFTASAAAFLRAHL